ncbi:MAG: pyrimidine 5'-nucleotidase [Chloroflexi bacterium]|nr:pyrimidine 5'-nucleotidase [Chloroflexota bacterium]
MSRITHILLDLDGTLYPHNNGLWEEIAHRMESYMEKVLGIPAADIPGLRQSYFREFGTTLRGLQANYQLDSEAYLAYVHDLPLERYLQPDARLQETLRALPQPKYIFTNSDRNHAQRVLAALGIRDLVAGVVDVWALGYLNKPDPAAYRRALDLAGVSDPSACLMVEDTPQNLRPAFDLGMVTALVTENAPPDYAQFTIPVIYALSGLGCFDADG